MYKAKLLALVADINKHLKRLYRDMEDVKRTAPQAYVQSRGRGLITNGSGLLMDNTNFSKFNVDKTQARVGPLSFWTGAKGVDYAIDELIPVAPDESYTVSFYAKYGSPASGRGKTYFYVAPYDTDGNAMTPLNVTEVSFTFQEYNHHRAIIAEHDRERFEAWFRPKAGLKTGIRFLSKDYTSKTGYIYPRHTYSQDFYSSIISFSSLTYDKDTGEIKGIGVIKGIEGEDSLGIAVAGGTYAYIIPSMLDSTLSDNWMLYSQTFTPKQILPNTPNAIQNKMFSYASYIKIGWLLNRNAENSVTYLSGIDLQ